MATAISVKDKIYVETNPYPNKKDLKTYSYKGKTWYPILVDNQELYDSIDALIALDDTYAGYNTQHLARLLKNLKKLTFDPRPQSDHRVYIPDLALIHFSNLADVEFPKDARLGKNILWNRTSLKSVSFPGTMYEVPAAACAGATNLTSVKFNSDVETLGFGCFKGCKNLVMELPKSIQYVEGEAMMDCLANNGVLVIPKTCRYVGSNAFRHMNMKQVIIENPNTKIDYSAFRGCKDLKTVQINGRVFPVSCLGELPMFVKGTEYVHGIKVTSGFPITGKIEDDNNLCYYAEFGDFNCLYNKREEAIYKVRTMVMNTRHKKQIPQDFNAETCLNLGDISMQELYCLENHHPCTRNTPYNLLPLTRKQAEEKGIITDMDCTKCQKIHPMVYHKCMSRYGFEK